ncbi:hypothetical protein C8R45DRAFT_931565 [Mycena sanguinolenta]|nr:hypothetical protein C8R45DRAFT_931565 [Mycena sanguinolenta]
MQSAASQSGTSASADRCRDLENFAKSAKWAFTGGYYRWVRESASFDTFELPDQHLVNPTDWLLSKGRIRINRQYVPHCIHKLGDLLQKMSMKLRVAWGSLRWSVEAAGLYYASCYSRGPIVPTDGPETRRKADIFSRKCSPKTAGKKKKRIVLVGGNTDDEDDWPDNETDLNFLTFLNIVVGGSRNGFSDTLGTIGEQLGRWNTRVRWIQYCDDNCKTGRKGKPYRVPEEYKEHANPSYHGYANRPFTKKNIADALGICNGTVTADRNAFDCPDIECDPLAQRWVKGDETLDPKVIASFNKMKRKAWLAHLEKAKAEKAAADKAASRAKQREQRVASNEQKRGKRQHESDEFTDSEVDSEDERRAKHELKRIKKKQKAQEVGNGNEAGPSRHKERSKAPTSEYLDNDSDPTK